MHSISCLPWGDHTIELYSSKGKTYTVKARKGSSVSRETKLRRIALARWFAFVTICVMGWVVGFKDTFSRYFCSQSLFVDCL